MKKRLLIMSSVLILAVAGLSGCKDDNSNSSKIPSIEEKDQAQVEEKHFQEDESGFAKVADNDKYELYTDSKGTSLQIKEKSTGTVWSTSMNLEKVGLNKENVSPKKMMRYESPLQITYYNTKKDSAAAISAYLSEFDFSEIKTYSIKEDDKDVGLRAIYSLESYGNDSEIKISLAVDYLLKEDGFSVRIPSDAITEEGNYNITTVTVLPYFAAASNSDDGYFFYPDGSGALMEFKDTAHHGEPDVSYQIYGNLQNYKNTLNEWAEGDSETFMPIYGANINKSSFLAIIDQGEETARIKVSPSKSDVEPVNYLSCEFEFRKSFDDMRFAAAGANKQVLTYDKELNNIERSITYHLFESGTDTSYSDMAVGYREYLIENGIVEKKEADEIPMSLDLFMGIKEEGMIRDSFNTVTSFKQVDEILQELKDAGVDALDVQLKGWTKNGYYTDPVQFPVNSDIGGGSELKSLTDKYKDDKHVNILLDANFIEAKAEAKGYNLNTDTITLGNFSVFTDYNTTTYLLSPNVARANFDQMVKDAEQYSINGVSFYSIGQYLLYNYNSNNTLSLSQCKLIWKSMLEDAQETYDKITVQGGNQYVLASADKLTDIPYEDCGYRISTQSVPVYQIAVHGLVEYTGKAGNLSSNLEEEELKWIEYGYTPYFELSYDGSEKLMHTEYNNLFSSTFSTWKDEVVRIYKEYNDNLKNIWHAFITDHEEIAPDVYKVTYDNGSVVYVNYNDTEFVVDGNTTVDANSYLLK